MVRPERSNKAWMELARTILLSFLSSAQAINVSQMTVNSLGSQERRDRSCARCHFNSMTASAARNVSSSFLWPARNSGCLRVIFSIAHTAPFIGFDKRKLVQIVAYVVMVQLFFHFYDDRTVVQRFFIDDFILRPVAF